MSYWNDTIFTNATKFYETNPTNYSIDGCLSCSGVLDVAREVQLKIKHWGYAYKLSNDTKWADRAWRELEVSRQRLRLSLKLMRLISPFSRFPDRRWQHLASFRSRRRQLEHVRHPPYISPFLSR